jgi:hypothetical protein
MNPSHVHAHRHCGENSWDNNTEQITAKCNAVFVFGVVQTKRLECAAEAVQQVPEE